MFAKLLKHDCKAIFKHWWILGACSVLFALIAGACQQVMYVSYTTHFTLQAIAYILFGFSVLALFFFPLLSAIMAFRHMRRHFFTDEGYLTFTLPVSKSALLSSKLVATLIFAFFTIQLFILDIVLLATASGENIFEMFEFIADIIAEFYRPHLLAVALENIIFNFTILAALAAGILYVFMCITLSHAIAKKRRLLVGIGLFYGIDIALIILARIIYSTGALDLINVWRSEYFYVFTSLFTLAITVIFAAGLYLINLHLLDKKLNLE